MEIKKHFSLKSYNSFGIEAKADWFVTAESESDLKNILVANTNKPKFILGGGSNMLLTQDIHALVIHVNLKGIQLVNETENEVWIESKAGENWHEFVQWTLANDFGGLENMSLIPGNVGTTPVQNIGAYGKEIKDNFVSCQAMNIETQEMKTFGLEDCHFGYRESVFKNELKDQYIICSVVFKLTKKDHQINIDYGDIVQQLKDNAVENITIQDVSKAVIAIRQRKLPDPKILGNSGSFFKNPIISKPDFEEVQKHFPGIKFYPLANNQVKVPAGWLIEQVGFKGKRFGDAGVHVNQALVLVNYGNATGQEILDLSKDIQQTVFNQYGITIEAEVNIM